MNNKNNRDSAGKILIADDEKTFLTATAQLLRNEGFECDCAEDAAEASAKLSEKTYDLLIADIKMQGNANLELVKKLSEGMPRIKVILVTGYPSQQTAIEAISLSVTAYLVKPLDFAELLKKTKHAVKLSRLSQIAARAKENLRQWINNLENIEISLQKGKEISFDKAFESFIEETTAKISEAFKSLRQAVGLLDAAKQETQMCRVVQCRTLTEVTKGIKEAVTVLKNSREIYKSKQLGKTRVTLEKLLKNVSENSGKD